MEMELAVAEEKTARHTAHVKRLVYGMMVGRAFFGVLNVGAALLMLLFRTPESALALNGFIGSVGPFVQIGVGALGIAGVANGKKVSRRKIVLLVGGMICLLIGTR